jgi:hypothetical protein
VSDILKNHLKKEGTMKRSERIPPVIYDLKDDLDRGTHQQNIGTNICN